MVGAGQNFSGCSAQGNPAKPTGVLTVQVGIFTAAKVKDVLATTKTSATGSFSVQITVPKVSAGGKPQIGVAAQSTAWTPNFSLRKGYGAACAMIMLDWPTFADRRPGIDPDYAA